MKYFVLLLCLFFSVNFCNAKTYKLGVTYTPQIAKEIAYKNVAQKINVKRFERYKIDVDNKLHLESYLNDKLIFKDKKITFFSDGEYCIVYKNKKRISYQYNNQGQLEWVGILKGNNYPFKKLRYNTNGELIAITLSVSKNEQFIFDNKGNLLSYWVNENCYDLHGNIIGSRIEFEY